MLKYSRVMLAGHLLRECTFQLKRVLMSDVWLSKKREVEGEKWRECVRIDSVQKGMIQQDNTLIFLFWNCNKLQYFAKFRIIVR